MPWSVELTIRYDKSMFSIAQITHMFNKAGFSIGVGDKRPQQGHECGMFHVQTGDE